jgi:hypothetical protein
MWLFEPSSPWIATFTNSPLAQATFDGPDSTAQLATSLRYNATYHKAARGFLDMQPPGAPTEGETRMLWTITVILFVLWLVGMVSSYTLGGWIHLLLVLAVIVLIFNLLSGRRVV